MSGYSGTQGEYTPVNPQYVNEKYLQKVGVISMSTYRHPYDHMSLHETEAHLIESAKLTSSASMNSDPFDHVSLNETESQLIENAKLTSSEREVKKLRLSRNFDDVSDTVSNQGSKLLNEFIRREHVETVCVNASEQRDEDYISTVDVEKDDAEMFYETQTDESTLINYAKLADDGLYEATKYGGKLLLDIVSPNAEELKLRLNISEENVGGFQTPVNSENGDKDTDEIKRKLGMCYQVSRKIDVSETNNTESDKYVARHNENQESLTLSVAKVAEKSKRTVARINIQDEISGAGDGPRDDDFCNLVDEVVHQLQNCDLDEILAMFSGSGILEMTGLVPPSDLMEILQRHKLISRDNLYHLQGLIIRLDDTDLYIKAVQYTRHHNDIVFFYQEQDVPTKGFGKVRCFVGGRDFTRLTREDLELVRFKVACLVFMPAHCVYIVGIEPGQKVVVTLMLLERYVQELAEMAKEGLAELSLVKVDAIQIYGKTYSTTGTTAIEQYRDEGYASFLSVYQQLRDKSNRLEERDAEVTKLREEAELKQLELETMGAELELLTEKALHETVGRKRLRDRPVNRHPRTRSFPLSDKENVDDKTFAQALESAVVTKAVERVPIKQKHNFAKTVHNTVRMAQSGRDRDLPIQDNTSMAVTLRSHENMSTSVTNRPQENTSKAVMDKYEMFQETNELMDEIEAILGELALTGVK